jgi:hypothetical protein
MILLVLLAALAEAAAPARGAIEATIRGTAQPLEVELLLRGENDGWAHVDHKRLAAETRVVRFDGLAPGVYQLRVMGKGEGEQLGMKVGVGRGDVREVAVDIQPRELTGRVTLGGVELGAGALFLRHKELGWEAGISLGQDGSFSMPFWQAGSFTAAVRSPAMATSYSDTVDLGEPPYTLSIDIPDGRIRGVLRDAKSGAPAAGVTIALQTRAGASEHHVTATSDLEGRFDFTGIKYGQHTVRIRPAVHLEPQPIEFELNGTKRLHELDVPLEPGRTIPLLVVDAENDPVEKATVFAIAGARLCARATTDEDGRASVAVPEREAAMLFVLLPDGGFGVLPVAREHAGERLRVELPPPSSSLLIRARTTTGTEMPPFSLLMRYNGALIPPEAAEELHLSTGRGGEVRLENIPSGSYEFWPYRTDEEAEAIVATGDDVPAPIRVQVREGENRIAVKFAAR